MGDAMKSLENRALDSKQDMDILAALEEMRSMKVLHFIILGFIFIFYMISCHGKCASHNKDWLIGYFAIFSPMGFVNEMLMENQSRQNVFGVETTLNLINVFLVKFGIELYPSILGFILDYLFLY